LALLWCIAEAERRSRPVYFLAGAFFVGGLARMVSILAVGPPNAFFLAMTALELVLPPFMVLIQARISRARSVAMTSLRADPRTTRRYTS
jgi:hypothetical protein